jgi:hypothetical protein
MEAAAARFTKRNVAGSSGSRPGIFPENNFPNRIDYVQRGMLIG